jgi:hypothetical protein
MRIGLIDIEPTIFNTALMQISQHHKQQGDIVEWAAPLEYDKYDKLFCSSLFDFTKKDQLPDRTITGGTGFDLTTKLPYDCQLDYSIYPKCKTSYVWFSRGCNRNCPWCVVPEKEGNIYAVRAKNLNPKGEYITVQDNNFFANPLWADACVCLAEIDQPVDFQGADVRRITTEQCKALSSFQHYKQIKIAWDNPKDEKEIIDGIIRMIKYIPSSKIMCYVLIGYYDDEDEDLYRVETLHSMGIDPFVMPYNKSDRYEKMFARWVNRKAIFKSVQWEDYREGQKYG